MDRLTRRETIAIGAGGLTAAGLIGQPAHAAIPTANVPLPKHPIEAGATLRVIRPTKFVDPDETIWNENTARFTKTTGIPVRTDFVGWEDIRAQVAVAARTGAGPDIVAGWANDPHLYEDKILDMTELATYLGKKYGGWGPLPLVYGRKHGTQKWLSIPMGCGGGALVYRKSWVNQAGYEKPPNEMDKFLDLCRKLHKANHPVGWALGNSQGDGNGTATWLLWSHGAYQVDEAGKVAINSKETIEALKYSAELYKTFIPGTLSWLDPSNNKAYIAEEISMTSNGVSIYFVLKSDPKSAVAIEQLKSLRDLRTGRRNSTGSEEPIDDRTPVRVLIGVIGICHLLPQGFCWFPCRQVFREIEMPLRRDESVLLSLAFFCMGLTMLHEQIENLISSGPSSAP